ncbi:MAG TPA: hypothetical protein VFJ58_18865 [Armatimonadota bacterium]|nr:hypothetical protein [Armatimonadota bacterium]
MNYLEQEQLAFGFRTLAPSQVGESAARGNRVVVDAQIVFQAQEPDGLLAHFARIR